MAKTVKKKLTIQQIELATNTDDQTVGELLTEDKDENHKLPYDDAFVKKHNLRKPAKKA